MPKRKARELRRSPSSAYCGDRQRQRRIEAILIDVARHVASGDAVDPAAVVRQHEDLLPELAGDLSLLLAARQRAQTDAQADTPTPAIEQVLDEELAVLRQTLEQYELLERVRYGGQGVVYRARQRGTQRIVALKVLLDGPLATERQRARFEREIELVARLRHPHIVTVYESGVVRGRNFYAMEFVAGDPIDDYAALADLAPRQIVQLMLKICRAVHHAHQSGIIHRDLNPSNILVDQDGQPRIFDFGLAKDLWAEGEDSRYTLTGLGCGTLPYLSPEQAGGGDGLTDVRTDVYAVGLILYELLTDMFPYPVRGEPSVVRHAILHEEALPLRQALAQGRADWAPGRDCIDRDLEAIVAKAVAKAKDDRYQTAAALADDLERWLAGDAISVRAGSRRYIVRKLLRKHKVAVGFAAVIVTACTVSAIGITHYWLQARAERDNSRSAARAAYDLFDTSLTDVEEAVRPLPGGVAVRDRLIGRLADKLPELARLAQSDPALDSVGTRLLEKQGDIAFQQGQRSAAVRYYQAFLAESLHRAEAESGSTAFAAAVLRGYRKLAAASGEPVPLLERGLRAGNEFVKRVPECEATRYELCRLLLALGLYWQNDGRYPDAVRYADETLRLCRTERQPPSRSDRRWMRIQAEALTTRGLALHKLGESVAGREAIEQGLKLREQVVAADPADTEARSALLWSCAHLGTLYRDAGESAEAKQYLRHAATQGEILAMMDPGSTVWESGRYSVHHRLASLCLDTGDLDEAKLQSAKAAAIAEGRAKSDSGEEAQTTLYFALMLKGKVHRSEQAWEAARPCYCAALSAAERLLERDPDRPDGLVRVADACDAVAFCDRRLGNPALALSYRQRACELQQRLSVLEPDAVDRSLSLIQAQINLAAAYNDLATAQDRARAAQLLAEAERRLAALQATGKLTGSERRYGNLFQAIRDNQAALQNADSAVIESQSEPAITDTIERPQ
jgi:tRNA A-37 threonylcarbamoyl transferase component Bud32